MELEEKLDRLGETLTLGPGETARHAEEMGLSATATASGTGFDIAEEVGDRPLVTLVEGWEGRCVVMDRRHKPTFHLRLLGGRLYIVGSDGVAYPREVGGDRPTFGEDCARYGYDWSPLDPGRRAVPAAWLEYTPILASYSDKEGVTNPSDLILAKVGPLCPPGTARYMGINPARLWDGEHNWMTFVLELMAWSQQDAADYLDIHARQRVSEWARGKRTVPGHIVCHIQTLIELRQWQAFWGFR